MMKRYLYISRNYKHPECGGNRARTDIELVLDRLGYKNIGLPQSMKRNGIIHALRNTAGTLKAISQLRKGDVLVVQYQMRMYERICRAARRKGASVVCLIHDLDSWRNKTLTPAQEIPLLEMADVLLTHNHAMRSWLRQQGCSTPMVDYEIMDYLHGDSAAPHPYPVGGKFSVFFVGNLSSELNGWIYGLAEAAPQLQIYLYGAEEDKELCRQHSNIRLCGLLKDNDIIACHEGDFGISWYGSSLDDACGTVGEYMKINNPHKVGLYLRCNAPVVVWKNAGRAKLLCDNNIGIAVDSLRDLPAALAGITPAQYEAMTTNIKAINAKLKEGYFLKEALEKAIEIIEKNDKE